MSAYLFLGTKKARYEHHVFDDGGLDERYTPDHVSLEWTRAFEVHETGVGPMILSGPVNEDSGVP